MHTDEQNEDQNHDQNHDETVDSVEPVESSELVVEVSDEKKSPSRKLILGIIAGIVVVAVAVATTLALTVFKPEVVANVGKDVVTVKDVTNSVNEILAERKGVDTTGMQIATGADLTLEEVNFHVIAYLLADTAKANNVTVSDAEVATRKASIVSQLGSAADLPKALVAANIASADLNLYIRSLLYDEKLANLLEAKGVSQADAGAKLQADVATEATDIGVKINPKYGNWDSTQAVVTAPTAKTK